MEASSPSPHFLPRSAAPHPMKSGTTRNRVEQARRAAHRAVATSVAAVRRPVAGRPPARAGAPSLQAAAPARSPAARRARAVVGYPLLARARAAPSPPAEAPREAARDRERVSARAAWRGALAPAVRVAREVAADRVAPRIRAERRVTAAPAGPLPGALRERATFPILRATSPTGSIRAGVASPVTTCGAARLGCSTPSCSARVRSTSAFAGERPPLQRRR